MGIRDRIETWRYEREMARLQRLMADPSRTASPTAVSQQRRFYLGVSLLVFVALAYLTGLMRPLGGVGTLVTVAIGAFVALGTYMGGIDGWGGRHSVGIRTAVLLAYLAYLGATAWTELV